MRKKLVEEAREHSVLDEALGMRAFELMGLSEGLSDVLYHRTGSAAEILSSDTFNLTPAWHGKSDDLSGKGKRFYLSTSRSHQADYFGQQVLVLDGRKLGMRYAGAPVDYWGASFRDGRTGAGKDEMEDRVFSDSPTIPKATSYIKEVHVLADSDVNKGSEAEYHTVNRWRTIFKAAKAKGIPVFFYKDTAAFNSLTKSKAVSPAEIGLTRPLTLPGQSFHDKFPKENPFLFALEIFHAKTPEDVSKKNKYWLSMGRYRDDEFKSQFQTSLHNYKSDAKGTRTLLDLMKKAGVKTPDQLADVLYKKMQTLLKVDR